MRGWAMKVALFCVVGISVIGCKPAVNSSVNALTQNGAAAGSVDVCLLSAEQGNALKGASEVQAVEKVDVEQLPAEIRQVAKAQPVSNACGAPVISSLAISFPSIASGLNGSFGSGSSVAAVGLVGEGMFGLGVATVEVVSVKSATYYFGRNSSGMLIETIRLINHRER